jgi:ATP-dependent RNA helicase RhlE
LHALVLDEADQMLDMGFVNDVKKNRKTYTKKQTDAVFSATMPIAIRELAEMFLTNPETVTVSPFHLLRRMEQHVYFVEKQKETCCII